LGVASADSLSAKHVGALGTGAIRNRISDHLHCVCGRLHGRVRTFGANTFE
jgi:hypothetical protein